MRYGIVPSGGDAKGSVYIVLLELIGSLQIRVDYTSGTSMGAVAAGLYSVGHSASQTKELTRQENWGCILSSRLPYNKVDVYKRGDHGVYTLELPMHRGTPKPPSSIIEGRYLMEVPMRYTFPVRHIIDYARMPIPL